LISESAGFSFQWRDLNCAVVVLSGCGQTSVAAMVNLLIRAQRRQYCDAGTRKKDAQGDVPWLQGDNGRD
jgi:hypothetical protein